MEYRERDEEKRKNFCAVIAQLDAKNIVYVDETGIDKYLYRPYAWAPKGQICPGKISGRKYERTSIVAGLCGKKILAPLQYSGTMDSSLFKYWFVEMLLPSLHTGCVIVMDNASFHQKAILAELAACHDCSVLFLPPYSPDLNPIEHFWAFLKARLRNILSHFHSLDDALMDCFKVD